MSNDIRTLAVGLGFPEGPVAMRDGSVIFVELNVGRVSRVDAAGGYSVLGPAGGGPNGLAMGPDGLLYLCNNGGSHYEPGHFAGQGPSKDYNGGSIERVDPVTGARTVIYRDCDGTYESQIRAVPEALFAILPLPAPL